MSENVQTQSWATTAILAVAVVACTALVARGLATSVTQAGKHANRNRKRRKAKSAKAEDSQPASGTVSDAAASAGPSKVAEKPATQSSSLQPPSTKRNKAKDSIPRSVAPVSSTLTTSDDNSDFPSLASAAQTKNRSRSSTPQAQRPLAERRATKQKKGLVGDMIDPELAEPGVARVLKIVDAEAEQQAARGRAEAEAEEEAARRSSSWERVGDYETDEEKTEPESAWEQVPSRTISLSELASPP